MGGLYVDKIISSSVQWFLKGQGAVTWYRNGYVARDEHNVVKAGNEWF